jgi:hypothetical protein
VALGKLVRIAYTLFLYLYPVLPDFGASAEHIALLNGVGNGRVWSPRANGACRKVFQTGVRAA